MTDLFLWAAFPYACVAVALVGFAWRLGPARRTVGSRSSQFLEGRALFWGSVPWHHAILCVLAAHLGAVLFPGAFGRLLGDPRRLALAEMTGLALGGASVAACAVLAARRLGSARLRVTTTPPDVAVLALLLLQVATGVYVAATLRWGSVWYLHTAVPWLRSLARLSPEVELVALLPPAVKIHALSAFALLALAPYSRLVHAVVAPVSYLWRAPQVVVWNRRRGARAA